MRPNRLSRLGERAVLGADQVADVPLVPEPYAEAYLALAQAHTIAARRATRPGEQVGVLDIDHEASRVGALASIVFLAWMGTHAWTGD